MKTSYGWKLLPYLRPYRLRFFWELDFPFCRHKPDLPPVYDVLSAAVAARRATLFRPQVPPAPEGLRREPELPRCRSRAVRERIASNRYRLKSHCCHSRSRHGDAGAGVEPASFHLLARLAPMFSIAPLRCRSFSCGRDSAPNQPSCEAF